MAKILHAYVLSRERSASYFMELKMKRINPATMSTVSTNRDNELQVYEKPTIDDLGLITQLTTGGSGTAGDVTGRTVPGPIIYPPAT